MSISDRTTATIVVKKIIQALILMSLPGNVMLGPLVCAEREDDQARLRGKMVAVTAWMPCQSNSFKPHANVQASHMGR